MTKWVWIASKPTCWRSCREHQERNVGISDAKILWHAAKISRLDPFFSYSLDLSRRCFQLSDFVTLLQAKYLAQIIVMGAQVVGRAFARALQQEFAGMVHDTARIYTRSLIGVDCHNVDKQMTLIHPHVMFLSSLWHFVSSDSWTFCLCFPHSQPGSSKGQEQFCSTLCCSLQHHRDESTRGPADPKHLYA